MSKDEVQVKTDVAIIGLDKLAQAFPDGGWYRMTLYIRKHPEGAVVHLDRRLVPVAEDQVPAEPSAGEAIPKEE